MLSLLPVPLCCGCAIVGRRTASVCGCCARRRLGGIVRDAQRGAGRRRGGKGERRGWWGWCSSGGADGADDGERARSSGVIGRNRRFRRRRRPCWGRPSTPADRHARTGPPTTPVPDGAAGRSARLGVRDRRAAALRLVAAPRAGRPPCLPATPPLPPSRQLADRTGSHRAALGAPSPAAIGGGFVVRPGARDAARWRMAGQPAGPLSAPAADGAPRNNSSGSGGADLDPVGGDILLVAPSIDALEETSLSSVVATVVTAGTSACSAAADVVPNGYPLVAGAAQPPQTDAGGGGVEGEDGKQGTPTAAAGDHPDHVAAAAAAAAGAEQPPAGVGADAPSNDRPEQPVAGTADSAVPPGQVAAAATTPATESSAADVVARYSAGRTAHGSVYADEELQFEAFLKIDRYGFIR